MNEGLNAEKILDGMPLPACVLTSSHQIIFCNEAFREFFSSSFSGQSPFPFDLITENPDQAKRDFDSCTEGGQPVKITSLAYKTDSGIRNLHLLLSPFEGASKNAKQLLVLCIEENFFRSEENPFGDSQDGFEDIQRFLQAFVHECKNPLTVLKGSLQMLSRKFSPDSQEYRFSRISLEELGRIHHLLDNLISFEFAKNTDLEEQNLHRILDEMILFQSHPDSANPFLKEYDPSLPEILTHPYLLRQVIINLLKNALIACSQGETIIIKTGYVFGWELPQNLKLLGKKYAFADIIDHGPGIPEEIRKKLFNPFFTTRKNGTGLGLSVSKRIMNRLKGDLEYLETQDTTRFRIYIPIELI